MAKKMNTTPETTAQTIPTQQEPQPQNPTEQATAVTTAKLAVLAEMLEAEQRKDAADTAAAQEEAEKAMTPEERAEAEKVAEERAKFEADTNAAFAAYLAAHQPAKVEMLEMPVGDFFAACAAEIIKVPEFQRSNVWTEKQNACFAADFMAGMPVPPLTLVRIQTADGTRWLLIDGCQRKEALRYTIDKAGAVIGAAENTPDAAAAKMYANARTIQFQQIDAQTLEEAARHFMRYNSGARLTGAQKGKAQLSPETQKAVTAYAKALAEINPGKWGKLDTDTLATMILAAAIRPNDATSSSAGAVKALNKSGEVTSIPAAAEKALAFARAIAVKDRAVQLDLAAAEKEARENGTPAPDPANYRPGCFGPTAPDAATYWRQAPRLVAIAATAALQNGNDKATASLYADVAFATKTGTNSVWADTANSKKATTSRVTAFKKATAKRIREQDEEDPATPTQQAPTIDEEEVAENAAILEGMLK